MNDREEWRERVRDIRATSAIWWWWWNNLNFQIKLSTTLLLLLNSSHSRINECRFLKITKTSYENIEWCEVKLKYFLGTSPCQVLNFVSVYKRFELALPVPFSTPRTITIFLQTMQTEILWYDIVIKCRHSFWLKKNIKMEHDIMKMVIIRYYLLINSTVLKMLRNAKINKYI